MKRITLFSAIAILVIIGCNPIDYGFYYGSGISLTYQNNKGELLLKEDSKIQIYYDINGEMLEAEKVISQTGDNRHGYGLQTDLSEYAWTQKSYVDVWIWSESLKNNISTTYIKFDNYKIDTIVCEHNITKKYHRLSKVWINNKLITDDYYEMMRRPSTKEPITIIK